MSKKNKSQMGVIFSVLLTIIFTLLKVSNEINLSWLWVFSPLWIPIINSMIVLFVLSFSLTKKINIIIEILSLDKSRKLEDIGGESITSLKKMKEDITENIRNDVHN